MDASNFVPKSLQEATPGSPNRPYLEKSEVEPEADMAFEADPAGADQAEFCPPTEYQLRLGPADLTPEQVARLQRIFWVLRRHNDRPFDEICLEFRLEEDPEAQIQAWEVITKVYQEERLLRPSENKRKQQLMFEAIVAISLTQDVAELCNDFPNFRAIDDLQRIIDRWKALAPPPQEVHHETGDGVGPADASTSGQA